MTNTFDFGPDPRVRMRQLREENEMLRLELERAQLELQTCRRILRQHGWMPVPADLPLGVAGEEE